MLNDSLNGFKHEAAYDLVIIGGGIAGLATLYYWLKARHEKSPGLPARVALFEKSGQLGGKIQTHILPLDNNRQCLLEAGPDSVLTKKPEALELMEELGLKDQLIPMSSGAKRLAVYDGQALTPFPEHCVLGIPTSLRALQKSALLSVRAKARAALEPFIKPRPIDGDSSVGDFLESRFGKQFVDRQAEVLLAGIFSADIYEQSLLTTLPELRHMLQNHGNLLKGAKSAYERLRSNTSSFVSLKRGMGTLIDALNERLAPYIHTKVMPVCVEPQKDGMFAVLTGHNARWMAKSVVIATPAPAAARLFETSEPRLASSLNAFTYKDTGSVYALYDKDALGLPQNNYGVMVQKNARSVLNALTVTSLKFDGRSSNDTVVLRAFFGGARRPDAAALSDSALLEAVPQDIARMFNSSAVPLHCQLFRHSDSAPQYVVGHLDRVAALEKELPAGVFLAGSAFRAPGIPACIADAKIVSHSVHHWLSRGGLSQQPSPDFAKAKSPSPPASPQERGEALLDNLRHGINT